MKPAEQELARAHCPVCCGDLVAELVFCSRCSTPHHEECWQFTGRCAIYGCSSEQFTGAEQSAQPELLVLDAGPDQPPVSGRGRTRRQVPAVIPETSPAVEMALTKRDAFRRWLRDLLDEGIGIPRLWTAAPVVQRRQTLPEPEHEVDSRRASGMIVTILLVILPFILLLALLGDPTPWVIFELVCYLGLTGFLHLAFGSVVKRELIVNSAQEVQLAVTQPPFGSRRQPIANLRGVAAVALLVQEDRSSGCTPGVVLLDFERRPIALPGLELPARRHGTPADEDVRRARATARFLGLTFAGAVDGAGHRRRLPAPDGSAPGS